MKLEFLFSVLQLWPNSPPSLHWKGPRQQPSKWGRQNRPPLFTSVLSALYWGKRLKRRTKLWKAAACWLASHPPSKNQKISRTNLFHSSFLPEGIISGRLVLFLSPSPSRDSVHGVEHEFAMSIKSAQCKSYHSKCQGHLKVAWN